MKVREDDGVVSAAFRKVQQVKNYVWGGGKCPRRYTWVNGCKAVEFDDVRE